MTLPTFFVQAKRNRVKIREEYIDDVASLLGVYVNGAEEAAIRAKAMMPHDPTEYSKKMYQYYTSLSQGLVGIITRLPNGIDKAKLELSRSILLPRVIEVAAQFAGTPLDTSEDHAHEPSESESGGSPGPREGRPSGDEESGDGHRHAGETAASVPEGDIGDGGPVEDGPEARPEHHQRTGGGTPGRKKGGRKRVSGG